MPGTLVITTLSDGTNSTSAINSIIGPAKAYVNFSGVTTVTIRASFNILNVVRNGTGDYTITMSTGMSDANYIVASQGQRQAATAPTGIDSIVSYNPTTAITASAFRITTSNGAGGVEDFSIVSLAVFR